MKTCFRNNSVDHNGVTMIEVLVSVAIIGVLASLLLPAIQNAREAARRISCGNNMRQIGIAVHSFVNSKNVLPAGYEFRIDSDRSIGNHGAVVNGFFALILPYLEQQNVELRYDYDQGYDHVLNQSVVQTKVSIYQCPAVPHNRMMKIRNNLAAYAGGIPDQGRRGQATDYFGIRLLVNQQAERTKGVFRAVLPEIPGFESESPLALSQITDGLSNTILIVEEAGRPHRYVCSQDIGTPDYYAGTWAGVNGEMIYSIDKKISIAPVPGDCFINCNNFYTPYSFHPGGINITRCDGSVAFVTETLDFAVWQGLVSPDNGEVVPLQY